MGRKRYTRHELMQPRFRPRVQHSLFFSFHARTVVLCTFSTTGANESRRRPPRVFHSPLPHIFHHVWPWFIAISRRSSLRFSNFSIITRNWIEAEPIKRPFSSRITIRGTMRIFRIPLVHPFSPHSKHEIKVNYPTISRCYQLLLLLLLLLLLSEKTILGFF